MRLSRLQNPIFIWDSSFIIGSICVFIVVISSSTFVNLDSTISWVVWIVATIMSLFISSLRFSILLLSEVYSLVWCVGSGVLLVGCCVLERNLPASVIEILLMTRCLLAKMGQTAVPAAWSGFAHVGHFQFVQLVRTSTVSALWNVWAQVFWMSKGPTLAAQWRPWYVFLYWEYFVSDDNFPW